VDGASRFLLEGFLTSLKHSQHPKPFLTIRSGSATGLDAVKKMDAFSSERLFGPDLYGLGFGPVCNRGLMFPID